MKIYVDTSWFLSFYQSNTERRQALDEARRRVDMIVLTDQNITEYRRNRASLAKTLRESIQKSTDMRPHTTGLLRDMEEHKRVLELAGQLRIAGQALVKRLETDVFVQYIDVAFNAIVAHCNLIQATDEDIARAQRRKLRGIPPSSSKRDTIGDELIWECLLRECEEDLAIVSMDSDFLRHRELLAAEYAAHPSKRQIVYIGDRLSKALEQFGSLTKELYDAEYHIDPSARCGNCGSWSWHYAGPDEDYKMELNLREAAGYPKLDKPRDPGFEQHVHICGHCRSIILLT